MSRRYAPQSLVAALCGGLALSNAARADRPAMAVLALALAVGAVAAPDRSRLCFAAAALASTGWWWGSGRLDALDRSGLTAYAGTAERSRVAVTGPPRRSRFELRVPARITR